MDVGGDAGTASTPASGAETSLQTLILVLGIAIFALVAYGDVRRRRIPNALAVAIGALGLVRMILAGDPSAFLHTLAAGAAVFAAAFLLFWRGLVGGGDVKLLTAASLLVGYHDLLSFLLLMSLSGAVVSIAVVAANKLAPSLDKLGLRPIPRPVTVPVSRQSARLSVPYGVAIAAAGVVILVLQSSAPG